MLVGSADLDRLAADAPTLDAWPTGSLELAGTTIFQLNAEMRNVAREDLLPPGLHPTVPPVLSIQVLSVASGSLGAFTAAFVRVSCRSGVRARGFTTRAVASTDEAAQGLIAYAGYPCRVGEVVLDHHYNGVDASVVVAGETILETSGLDPEPLDEGAVQYAGTMNLAHTPNGLRLLQVEWKESDGRAERLRPKPVVFNGEAWGDARLDPYHPITATVAQLSLTIPPLRFVCKPDELAFTGTEKIG